MNPIMVYGKAIAAFVAGVVANVIVNLINGTTPWPHTSAQWIQLAVTSFGAAIGALLTPNKITQKQVDKDPTVIRVGGPSTVPPVGGWPKR